MNEDKMRQQECEAYLQASHVTCAEDAHYKIDKLESYEMLISWLAIEHAENNVGKKYEELFNNEDVRIALESIDKGILVKTLKEIMS